MENRHLRMVQYYTYKFKIEHSVSLMLLRHLEIKVLQSELTNMSLTVKKTAEFFEVAQLGRWYLGVVKEPDKCWILNFLDTLL